MKKLFLYVLIILVNDGLIAQSIIDSSFADNGKLQFSIDDYNNVSDLLLLENDTLLLLTHGGHNEVNFYDMSVSIVKLDPNGGFVSTFGQNGTTTFDYEGLDYSAASKLSLTHDNKILIVGNGYSSDSNEYRPMCITQLNTNGIIDSSFGVNGTMKISFLNFHEVAQSITNYSTDHFLIAGNSFDTIDGYTVPVIARIDNSDQTLDSTFGGTGKIATDFFNGLTPLSKKELSNNIEHLAGGTINDVVVINDSSIIIAGIYEESCFIAKLGKNGDLDYSFNGVGYILFKAEEGYPNEILKLMVLPDNSVLFNVSVPQIINRNVFIGRININNATYTIEEYDINGQHDLFSDFSIGQDNQVLISARSIKPQNVGGGYRSDYFAFIRIPDYDQLENYHTYQFPFHEEFESGIDALEIQSSGRAICAGFVKTANISNVDIALTGIYPSNINSIPTINHTNHNKITIYPNPSSGLVNVKSNQNGEFLVQNINGKVIAKGIYNQPINLSEHPRGLYFIRLPWETLKLVLVH